MALWRSLVSLLALLTYLSPAAAETVPVDQRVEIPFSSKIRVDGAEYSGTLRMKLVLVDEAGESRWSSDGSSVRGSQPENWFESEATEGVFHVAIGGEGMDALPASAFDGTSKLAILMWIDASRGFQRFEPIPLGMAPRSANALRLGGVAADQYIKVGTFIPIDNNNIVAPIESSRIAAFSDRGNAFTLGDGEDESDKRIVVNRTGEGDPTLRFNTTTSTWQYSNDGTSYKDIGSSGEFKGPDSTTNAVDLGSSEVAGTLPLAKGGTGATTASEARDLLGVRIGRDVSAFILHNFSATTDPSPGDDVNDGYSIGSRWINVASSEAFYAASVAPGAATWISVHSPGEEEPGDGSVTNAKLAPNAVTSDKILDGTISSVDLAAQSVTSGKLAPDSVGSSEITTNGVGSAELASSGVAAGTYPFATVTVDEDGRITSAASGDPSVGAITGIGDAESGPAFADGSDNGTKFIYEGPTIDTFENVLTFSGDPSTDTVVTIPNTTGTLITSGDTETVTDSMLASASVTQSKVADDAIVASKIATDAVDSDEIAAGAVGSSEIAAGAVGSSQLASTSVSAGTYNFASITVDADGRITSAVSNAEIGDVSAVGNVTGGNAFTNGDVFGRELVYEGVTDNEFETRLTFAGDPTSDSVVTIPNTTGTIVTTGDVGTVDSAMVSDSSISNIDIDPSAGIAHSKLAALATGQIIAGNGGVAAAMTMSGDATIGATGTVTIANNAVDGTNIAIGSDAQGDIMYYNGTDWARLGAGVSGQVLQTNGPGANPAWSSAGGGDILAVGNATSGSAFADGSNNGTQLIYEGATNDGFETFLTFTGDPTADRTVTIPNTTGTLVTTGDTGSVTSTMITDSTVATGDILDGTIANSDVSASAAIAFSKLAALNSTNILVGNASNVATGVAMSGDATLSNAGVLTIAANAVGAAEIADGTVASADIAADTVAAADIATGGVATAEILDGTIANVDISATAAIAFSKLAALNSTNILVGNASNVATGVTMSGDATLSNAGVLTIAANAVGASEITDGSVTGADISSTAAIAFSKLASLNSTNILVGNASNVATGVAMSGDATLSSTGALTISDNSVDGSDISVTGESAGDLMVFNGADWARLDAGAAGQVLTGNGAGVAPSWQSAATLSGTVLQHPVLSRRFGYAFPAINTATTFSAIGINTPTSPSGTASAQPALAGAARMYIQYATGAVAGNTGGLTGGAFTFTRPQYQPVLQALIRTDATISSERIHAGIAESSLATVVTNTTGTTASAVDFVSIAYDTGGTGNTTDWLCCAGDGTNYGCASTGVTVAPSTEYVLTIDWSTGGNLVCTVNGTSVSRGANLSIGAVNLGPYVGLTTLSAAARNFAIAKYSLEQN